MPSVTIVIRITNATPRGRPSSPFDDVWAGRGGGAGGSLTTSGWGTLAGILGLAQRSSFPSTALMISRFPRFAHCDLQVDDRSAVNRLQRSHTQKWWGFRAP